MDITYFSSLFSRKLVALVLCLFLGSTSEYALSLERPESNIPVLSSGNIVLSVPSVPENTNGLIISFYSKEDSFLKQPDKSFYVSKEEIMDGRLILREVPFGRLALAIAADTNGNQKLDTRIFGIPAEPVAFAGVEDTGFGIPKFSKCAIEHKEPNTTLTVTFKNLK